MYARRLDGMRVTRDHYWLFKRRRTQKVWNGAWPEKGGNRAGVTFKGVFAGIQSLFLTSINNRCEAAAAKE
jgi:hypothetical protein